MGWLCFSVLATDRLGKKNASLVDALQNESQPCDLWGESLPIRDTQSKGSGRPISVTQHEPILEQNEQPEKLESGLALADNAKGDG
jgi:hypothetical protein